MLARHRRIAEACRKALTEAGLRLHLDSGYSNTVTVFDVPKGTAAEEILEIMKKEHGIMLAGSLGSLDGQVIRIGHMGANANETDMKETMEALDDTLRSLGISLQAHLGERFCFYCNMACKD